MKAYGVGTCPVDFDVLACLRSRATGDLVFFCPLCGCTFRTLPPTGELKETVRLDQLAPVGVVLASHDAIIAAGYREPVELDQTWLGWVEEVLWHPPIAGETDEQATKARLDHWYSRTAQA